MAECFVYHPHDSEMKTHQKTNIEISLHHSQTYRFGFPNGPFQLTKWTVLRPKTDGFRMQNGMY